MRILIDMNLSPLWEGFFRSHGYPAQHWYRVGPATAPDEHILAWARDEAYVVFTKDLDFGRLLALTRAHGPSVIQVRTEDVLPEAIGDLVLDALGGHREILEAGALIVIDPKAARARILPIVRAVI